MKQIELMDLGGEARARGLLSLAPLSLSPQVIAADCLVMRSLGVLSFALTLTVLLAPEARGQAGTSTVTVSGHVSRAVFVSVAPGAPNSGDNLAVTYTQLNPHTVLVSLTTSESRTGRISIPVQLRSNAGYTLSASASTSGATLSELCMTGARSTGRFVAADAIESLNAATCETATAGAWPRNVNQAALPLTSSSTLLTGTRISLAGTINTPFNALEVTMEVEVEPHDGQSHGTIELILSASPASTTSASNE